MSEISQLNDAIEEDMNEQKVPVVAVILAAGSGLRFDPDNPKQLVTISGRPIVAWSIEAFEHNSEITDIVVVVSDRVRQPIEELVEANGYMKVRALINGGAERVDSTEAALNMLADSGIPGNAKVLFHDSVRPFVSQREINGCIDALASFNAATVACPSTDTVLLCENLGDRKVIKSVTHRPDTFRAQTPQAFRFETIRRAYEMAGDDDLFRPTDDTRVIVEYMPDEPVAIVGGSERNMKVTTPADMPIAEQIAADIAKAIKHEAVRDVFPA